MTQHNSRLCKGYFTKRESDGMLHQMTWHPQSPNLDPIEMIWDKSERRVNEKQTSAQHMLEKYSSWSWLRECQECAKLSSRQRVSTLKNLKYKSLFWFLHDYICYLIVLMSSLLFYNVEIVQIKKNPWIRWCVLTFDWYCTFIHTHPPLHVLLLICSYFAVRTCREVFCQNLFRNIKHFFEYLPIRLSTVNLRIRVQVWPCRHSPSWKVIFRHVLFLNVVL